MPRIEGSGERGLRRASSFRFGTKAETLERLAPLVKASRILPLYYFALAHWSSSRERVLGTIGRRLGDRMLVIRSSARAEDGALESMAGRFRSIQGIRCRDVRQLSEAIDSVASTIADPQGQVLVQPMLRNASVSGVISSHVIATGAPYYVLNYDDDSGRTDTVTGGTGASKAVYVFREAAPADMRSARVRRWLAMIREVERLTGNVPVELEFGQARDGKLYLFQVRRISESARRRWQAPPIERFRAMLSEFESCFRGRSVRRESVLGRRTILGEMSDWNPAEIIGAVPQALAASLYRMLVTDRVWRDARASMGYRALQGESLMLMIGNRPFIDVRNSFNSFLPAALDEATGERIVDAWLGRLASNPQLHDKVEFEVAQTALDFSFEDNLRERYPGLLRGRVLERYRVALRDLTVRALDFSGRGTLALNLGRIDQLARLQHRRSRRGDPAQAAGHPLQATRLLLDECVRLGTLPFAVIARHAFIAEALLRSAVKRGALSSERLDAFRASLGTVAADLVAAMCRASTSAAARKAFLARYGHLRPGMYDILSSRYDEQEDLFEFVDRGLVQEHRARRFVLTQAESRGLAALLRESSLRRTPPDELVRYAATAIRSRERAKFLFSRNLSDALLVVRSWGESQGISLEELANVPVQAILDCFIATSRAGAAARLKALSAANARSDAVFNTVPLSYLLCDRRDLYVVPVHRSAPNFVTTARVTGPTRQVIRWQRSPRLRGSIICIENADPGFDWIFVHGIAGLITKYGGANSHMTIRCAELGLPAAIGVGEHQFQRVVKASRVELNCREKQITPLG